MGKVGVLYWGIPWAPKGLGFPGVQGCCSNQSGSSTGTCYQTARSPERALSPLQGPRPTDREPVRQCSQRPAETTFRAGSSLLALTPPLSTPRDSATSAAVRTWSQDPPPRHHRVTVRRRIAIARKAPL